MVMRTTALLFTILLVTQVAKSAPCLARFEQPPDSEIACKAIDCRLDGKVKGVLVLVPGCNGDGRKFLSESNWVKFAERNHLALVGVTFKSSESLLKDRKGYYVSSRGSGAVLLSLLGKADLSRLPLLLFGFSGGAHFVSSFVEEYPDRVLAWCAHSAAWWGTIRRSVSDAPPGIVACGGEDTRLGASLSYFKDGRANGRRLSWVELPRLGHSRNDVFEEFVREYFGEMLGKNIAPTWIDLGSGQMISGKSVCAGANRSWMPSERLYRLWFQLVVSNAVPVITHRVQTHSTLQSQLTIFLRRPKVEQIKGVLCLCLLANNPNEIRWRMQKSTPRNEMGRLVTFAESNNLAIVAWGSTKGLWNPRLNWNDLEWKQGKILDKEFDHVAEAWEMAMRHFTETYNLPQNGYLLWGYSGAAQYAQRLALRKPTLFRAIHIHVSSSFDVPVPDGRSMLWCVTTGENENGYTRSLEFLVAARRVGYPIIYKAYPGLGHAGCHAAEVLGLECFRLALQLISIEEGREKLFLVPAFWGDVVNQTIWKQNEANMIPSPFRTALPTESIACAWSRQ